MYTDPSLSPFAREALMQKLPEDELKALSEGDDISLCLMARRILKGHTAQKRYGKTTHRLNYPIEEVLDDYVNHRTGKQREARRQLKKRFDGQDHAMQERIMISLIEHGGRSERDFVCEKFCDDDFWVDDYIPLVQALWEKFQSHKMAKVVIKRCPREYLLEHILELIDHGSYATLCLRTGLTPDPDKLSPQTYLFVMKGINHQLRFREGERTVLKAVRDYLYEHCEERLDTLYAVPYVRRMMAYLGEMEMVDDILAIDAFDKRISTLPREGWANEVIRAIEETFPLPEYIFKEVK